MDLTIIYRIVWFLSACAYLKNSKKYAPKSQVRLFRSIKLAPPPIYTCAVSVQDKPRGALCVSESRLSRHNG